MNKTNKFILTGLALAAVITVGTASYAYQGQGKNQGMQKSNQGDCTTDLGSLEQVSMTSDIEAGLLLMREEEKLARDVYLSFAELYGQRIFSNIARAEQQHMDKVGELLDSYGITDPIGSNPLGVFDNDSLQQLYDDLIAEGNESLEAALMVGVKIEELDIADLEKELASLESGTDIASIYENLKKGSLNHLRAFIRNLQNQGVSYDSEYISTTDFQLRGNGQGQKISKKDGNGMGQGKGQGRGQRTGMGQGRSR